MSPPFPKMFPRGGGYRDQDPILMRDFRVIRKKELEWKEIQEAQTSAFSGGGDIAQTMQSAMDDYIESLRDEGVSANF